MQKEIIVIGDVEIGAGNLTDDFISDKALSELILSLANKKHPLDLIMNGDTFDFLKCPFLKEEKYIYPRHITKDVSLGKLDLMHQAHTRLFEAWKQFAAVKDHNLYFIIGNHDHDLFFPEVQQQLRKLIGGNIHFPGLKYSFHTVYVEHGQQYDFLHQVNFKNLFVKYKGQSLLNFPWISFGLISAFMDLKQDHPFMERIGPRPIMLYLHSFLLRKVSLRSLGYFMKSILYYPFRYYADPTYRFPQRLFGELVRRMKSNHWDVDDIVSVFKRKRGPVLQKHKVYVLGHIHKKYIEQRRDCVIIHPGSWRDEYTVDTKNRILVPKKKHYVQIYVFADKLEHRVKEYPILRSGFLFDEVRKNELLYLQLAAMEEGYELKLPARQ